MTTETELDFKPNDRNTPLAKKVKRWAWIIKLPIIKHLYAKTKFPDGFDN
ncbi:MAG: hypothetical protein GY870_21430, partial [archaeon]|nr:hypothetical protein [archaeon]